MEYPMDHVIRGMYEGALAAHTLRRAGIEQEQLQIEKAKAARDNEEHDIRQRILLSQYARPATDGVVEQESDFAPPQGMKPTDAVPGLVGINYKDLPKQKTLRPVDKSRLITRTGLNGEKQQYELKTDQEQAQGALQQQLAATGAVHRLTKGIDAEYTAADEQRKSDITAAARKKELEETGVDINPILDRMFELGGVKAPPSNLPKMNPRDGDNYLGIGARLLGVQWAHDDRVNAQSNRADEKANPALHFLSSTNDETGDVTTLGIDPRTGAVKSRNVEKSAGKRWNPTQTGEAKHTGNVDAATEKVRGQAEKEIGPIEKQEQALHDVRGELGDALNAEPGSETDKYVPPFGKARPAMATEPKARAPQIASMQRRYDDATDKVARLIVKKYDRIAKSGGTADVPLEDALTQLGVDPKKYMPKAAAAPAGKASAKGNAAGVRDSLNIR